MKLVPQRPADEARIGAHHRAVPLFHMRVRAQEIGGHHRREQPRDQQREQHGDRDRQAELLEELAGDAAHEAIGMNTATIVKVVAITARPISSAASSAAR